jgi:hypothetical protein
LGHATYRQHRQWALKAKYGISLEQYERMYEDQGGECAICGDAYPVLAVDHCHKTTEVRGLLCTACNMGLAAFKDRLELLSLAQEYLAIYL